MRKLLTGRAHRRLIIGLLLVALAFRALVPAGFMPSAGRPFALQICHAGMMMPSDAPERATHPERASHFEHCPFGSAPGAAPIADRASPPITAPTAPRASIAFLTLPAGIRLERAQRARAPPRPA